MTLSNYMQCSRCLATLHVINNEGKPCPVCGKKQWKSTGIDLAINAGHVSIMYPPDADVTELASALHAVANNLLVTEKFRRKLGEKK